MRRSRSKLGSRPALLIVDVLNDLEFEGGDRVLPWAKALVKPLRAVCRRARGHGVPVIYANDHCGLWHAGTDAVFRHCSRPGVRGRSVTRSLRPHKSDQVIFKPRHSAFFATPLGLLLEELRCDHLILAGIATNLCVLMTAHDASMHGYSLTVLSDCCAAETDFDHNIMLGQLERFFGASICRSTELNWAATRRKPAR
jgi:nicotinamidase-related amidase